MLKLLMISPEAPPTLSAESIIVRRFLLELDKHCEGQVFCSKPTLQGWSRYDASMEVTLERLTKHNMQLPYHESAMRLLRSRFTKRFRCPDAEWWLQWMDRAVLRKLRSPPDILYSRFSPFGASMLPYQLKKKLNVPWVMHLSDPWPELPASHPRARAALVQRDDCFAGADKIAFTTQGQANYYAELFPQFAHKFFLSPNPVPNETELAPLRQQATPKTDDILQIVFAGSLYGLANFKTLLDAISILRSQRPELLKHLSVNICGNLNQLVVNEIFGESLLQYHGAMHYQDSMKQQAQADVLLSIETDGREPLRSKELLLTKVVSALGLMRPLLAITCKGSVTDALCRQGYGWSVAHSETERLATLLASLIEQRQTIRAKRHWKEPPTELLVAQIVQGLLQQMRDAIASNPKGSA